jgi:hypothetical protein
MQHLKECIIRPIECIITPQSHIAKSLTHQEVEVRYKATKQK